MSEDNQVVEDEVEVGVVENQDDAGEAEDQGGEDTTPDWMKDEEPEDGEGEKPDGDSVPAAKHASIKQRLRKKVKSSEAEVDRLRAEVEALKGGQQSAQQQRQQPARAERPVRPLESDFEYDTDKYRAALDKYYDDKERYDDMLFQDRQSRVTHQQDQERKLNEYKQTLSDASEAHYDRAAKLCIDNNIDDDLYRTANDNFHDAITRNLPENARNGAVETILSKLGPGSEKIAYKFGHNPAYRAKLEGWVREDPTCMKLMLELGAERKKVNNPVPRKSKASPPAAQATGGSPGTAGGDKMLKQYLKAKETSHQEALDIKEKAREAGVDVSDWYKK